MVVPTLGDQGGDIPNASNFEGEIREGHFLLTHDQGN